MLSDAISVENVPSFQIAIVSDIYNIYFFLTCANTTLRGQA